MLLFFFIFLLLSSPVSADGFDVIYNSSFNSYRQTTGLSYASLPESETISESGLSYDISLVEGVKTDDVWGNYTLETLTENTYWQRKRELLSKVSGPPETQIDLIYYYLNDTGHSIDVSKILLPFSRGDSLSGSWMNIIGDVSGVFYRDISLPWEQLVLSRKGFMKEYVGPDQIDYGAGGSLIIDSFVIRDPINIEKVEILAEGARIRMNVILKNLKEEDLENIGVSHGGFSSNYTIPAMDTVEIEYSVEVEEWGDILTVTNPNFARECILYGNSLSDWTTTEAITALAFREDGGWVNGSYLKPEGEDFCITQIPYSVNIPLRKPEIREEDGGIDDDSDRIVGQEDVVSVARQDSNSNDGGEEEGVLGIQADPEVYSIRNNNFVLPKTGVVIY